jgi:hypothetical protein
LAQLLDRVTQFFKKLSPINFKHLDQLQEASKVKGEELLMSRVMKRLMSLSVGATIFLLEFTPAPINQFTVVKSSRQPSA